MEEEIKDEKSQIGSVDKGGLRDGHSQKMKGNINNNARTFTGNLSQFN